VHRLCVSHEESFLIKASLLLEYVSAKVFRLGNILLAHLFLSFQAGVHLFLLPLHVRITCLHYVKNSLW
jgi:hypothetical protein